ncbi:hypothetical protein [Aureimonas flava]|uniref:hypothetical protein n=1 Tax=Aureimonas flava TaxID=2320271 RepID=UPI0010A96CE5|nr:hypothetical protein [Aureimonas flava]
MPVEPTGGRASTRLGDETVSDRLLPASGDVTAQAGSRVDAIVDASDFSIGAEATADHARVIRDTATGSLLCDADGTGSAAAQDIAFIDKSVALADDRILLARPARGASISAGVRGRDLRPRPASQPRAGPGTARRSSAACCGAPPCGGHADRAVSTRTRRRAGQRCHSD